MNDLSRPMPRPPAQIAPIVAVLGPELTVIFLFAFGGAELALSANPKGRSRLEALVGRDKAARLAETLVGTKARVPLAKPWTARMLAWEGHPVAEIARRLHVSDTSVRRRLKRT